MLTLFSIKKIARYGAFILLFLCSAATMAAAYGRSDYSYRKDQGEQSQRLWTRLRAQFDLPKSLDQARVSHWLSWYQKRPVHLSRLQEKAEPWLGYVLAEVEKRGLPAELALLPAVESAYDPLAYSHGRAAGLWQIIPSTATHLGLKRNWWYDERRDVPRSTYAALDYLEYLNRRFDNWLHALAAYNAGEGNVAKAIRRNRSKGLSTDFWSLKLPKETAAYVPKLLALAELIRKPEHYGVSLLRMPAGPRFEVVATYGQLDLAQAAKLADVSVNTLRRFNPGLNRWATGPEGPHRILLPSYAVEQFRNKLAQLPEIKRVKWRRHRVKTGETLSEIAALHRTRAQVIRDLNGINGNNIQPGDALVVAVGRKSLADYPVALPNQKVGSRLQRRHHTVQAGESLWLIARRHDIHISDIERWNNISRKQALSQGQRLVLWLPEGFQQQPSGPTHTVVAGDNLWDLARRYNITVDKLQRWNSLAKTRTLKQGQILRLSAPPVGSRGATRKVNYHVRSGDSLDYIARKFGVSVAQLCEWNGLNPRKYLQPGQRLAVNVPIYERWQDA